MTEKVNVIVESRVNSSGLDQTIRLLSALEAQANRTSRALGSLGGPGSSNGYESILARVSALQKAGGSLKPMDLSKVFGLNYDPAQLDRELNSFANDLRLKGERVRK